MEWLHTSGQNIYDSTGKQVKLNVCVIQNGCGMFISQTDIQAIKAMGFTGIKWWLGGWGPAGPNRDQTVGFQPTPTTMDATYFSAGVGAPAGNVLDTVVNWCEQAGLYIILGAGFTEWWGPPKWTKLSNTSPNGSAFWTDPTTRDGFYFMMNWVANRYATRPHVIFEGINEITGNSETDVDMPAWASFNNGWISAMEAGEGANRHLKIVQMLLRPSWSYITTNLPFVQGVHSNVMIASHSYPFVDGYMSPYLETEYAKRWADAIHSQGLPWQDTEFSTAVNASQTNPPPRDVGLQQAMNMFTKYNACGFGYFCYDSNSTHEGDWNIRSETNQQRQLILQVIGPYLQPVTPPPQFAVTLNAGANGTTSPVPNQYMVDQNANFTANAIPNTGYQIDYWSLDGNNVSTANSYTIQNVTAPHTLTAVFKAIVVPPKRTVKVNPGKKKTNGMEIDGGGVTNPVAGDYLVDPYTTLKITAQPDALSQFDSWVLDGNVVPNNPNPLEIAVGNTDHEVTPYYADITPIPAGFPWWSIPIGIVIGGYYLIKRHGKKPRG